MRLLQASGFNINWEKSVLTPCQKTTFLQEIGPYLPEEKTLCVVAE